jgi:hypothetical protein
MADHPIVTQVESQKRDAAIQEGTRFRGEDSNMRNGAEDFRDYLNALKRKAEALPDPNGGRIQELKDLIREGSLVTREAIREAAAKLTQHFLDGGHPSI